MLTQRNKFCEGDALELVTRDGPPVPFAARDLRDMDGARMESAPHPLMRFSMPLPRAAAPLSLVRRKMPE